MSQLFIKGIQEPFKISREEAEQVAKIMENEKIEKDQVVTISGWTGQKKDIRFITIEKERAYSSDKEYSNHEMAEFGRSQLAKYLVDGQLSMRDEFRFYSDIGVARVKELKEDPKTFTDFDFAIIDVGAYKEASDKISGWKEYRGRVVYAKKKEAEDLQAIADQNNG